MLLKMLRAYYNHVRAFENTLVAKFFGLHCVKLAGANQKKVRKYIIFICMITHMKCVAFVFGEVRK
jgi:hypothetical protein